MARSSGDKPHHASSWLPLMSTDCLSGLQCLPFLGLVTGLQQAMVVLLTVVMMSGDEHQSSASSNSHHHNSSDHALQFTTGQMQGKSAGRADCIAC